MRGALRVLTDPAKTCQKRETALAWNQTGPQGADGAAGADLRPSANTATLCLSAPGIPSQQLMATNALTFETRYSVRGSTTGTTAADLAWLPFFVTAGALTISIYGGYTARNSATFQNAVLLVRAISQGNPAAR